MAGSTLDTSDKKTIYTTFFPVYDLTKRVVGDRMDVKTIIKGNQEPHDFELQTSDMAAVSDADLIIFNGAGMEAFIDDLKGVVHDDNKFLDLSEGLTLLEGGGHDHDEHDHNDEHDDHEDHDDHDHKEHSSVNPHTWLSIKNAMYELQAIYEKVAALDPEHAEEYQQNYEQELRGFKALDARFESELSQVKSTERYFVVSHAAFNYLAHDYQLKQVAVTGISPDEEPSAAELATIADFVKAHNITTIFFEGKATPKVAQTLAENTHVKTGTLYTMESLTDEEAELGYLRLMEQNLDALLDSLNA
ncbi:zinc ABC transporter substrate-binding protein [Collinsella sp. zg1085]|nr:zinc ABC transporter substrate-binding protein [Collinsella sp. zg1085]